MEVSSGIEGFSGGCIPVEGAELYYVTGGKGEPLILLHGFPQTWWAWRHVMRLLASERQIVAFDLPGIGMSSAEDGFDRRTAARRLQSATKQLGFNRYALAGHDIGAMIGYTWAREFRDEVTHVIAVEGLLPGFGLEALLDCSRAGQQLWHFAFHADTEFSYKLISGREREYFPYFYDRESSDPSLLTKEAREIYVDAYQKSGGLKAGLGYYQSIFFDALDNQLHVEPKLSQPIVAIGGELSIGSAMAAGYRQVASDVHFSMIAGCGHFVPEERPEHLATVIAKSLKGI